MQSGRPPVTLSRRAAPATLIIATVMFTAGCIVGGGDANSAGAASPTPGSSATATPTPSPSASATPSVAPTPSESSLDLIDFDVNGSIGGHAVQGKLATTTFTVPCATSGSGQIITVHWIGEAPVNTPLQGEIDFKAGSWTLGSTSAQGGATVGIEGGKATDALVATSGTVTTSTAGGTINGTFTGGGSSLHLSGSWTCPTAG